MAFWFFNLQNCSWSWEFYFLPALKLFFHTCQSANSLLPWKAVSKEEEGEKGTRVILEKYFHEEMWGRNYVRLNCMIDLIHILNFSLYLLIFWSLMFLKRMYLKSPVVDSFLLFYELFHTYITLLQVLYLCLLLFL